LTKDRRLLRASGVEISPILFATSPYFKADDSAREAFYLANFGILPPTRDTLGLLARTLCAGRNQDGEIERDKNALLQSFAALLAGATKRHVDRNYTQQLVEVAGMAKDDANADDFRRAANQVLQERVLFFTARGHLGLGHSKVCTGDRLCVLAGSPMPVILRPNGTGAWFVGDCYVDGLMEGEAGDGVKHERAHYGPLGNIATIPMLDDYAAEHEVARQPLINLQSKVFSLARLQEAPLQEQMFEIR
jgi:hypothetical protein